MYRSNTLRRIYSLALIALFSVWKFSVYAQSEEHLSIVDKEFNNYFQSKPAAEIRGRIRNASPEELVGLSVNYTVVTPFIQFQIQKISNINHDGSFKIRLNYPFPYQQIWIGIGDFYYAGLYVSSDLNIDIDMHKIHNGDVYSSDNGIKYAGKDGDLNKWMNKFIGSSVNLLSGISNDIALLNDNDIYYDKHLDSLFKLKRKYQQEYVSQNPSRYSWILENELTSEYYSKILEHSLLTREKPLLWDSIRQHKAYLISNSGMAFNKNLYQYFTYVHADINFNKYTLLNETKKLDSEFGNTYADVLKFYIVKGDVKENKDNLKQLLASVKTPWCKDVFQKNYELSVKRYRNIAKILSEAKSDKKNSLFGKKLIHLPFDAHLSIVHTSDSFKFLPQLLKSVHNKAVIIDIWATWCGPCLQEMTYSRQLSEQAKELPIAFVYICTSNNSSVEKWKNKITELKQPGIHLFVDEKLVNQLMVTFTKTGFPSYICLDKAGKLSSFQFKHASTINLSDIKTTLLN